MSVCLIFLVKSWISNWLAPVRAHIFMAFITGLLAFGLLFSLKTISDAHNPIIFTHDSIQAHDKKLFWKDIISVSLLRHKDIGRGNYYWNLHFTTWYDSELVIYLSDIEASPYALAQIIKKYKPFKIDYTPLMRASLTQEYDWLSRHRGLIYIMLAMIAALYGIYAYLTRRPQWFKIP